MLLEVVVGLSDSLQRVKARPQYQGKLSNPDALPQPFLPSAFHSQPTPYSCRPTKPIPPKGQPFIQPPQCVLPNRFKNNRIPKPLPNTNTQSDLPSRRPSESQPEQTHTYTHKRTHTHTKPYRLQSQQPHHRTAWAGCPCRSYGSPTLQTTE